MRFYARQSVLEGLEVRRHERTQQRQASAERMRKTKMRMLADAKAEEAQKASVREPQALMAAESADRHDAGDKQEVGDKIAVYRQIAANIGQLITAVRQD